MTRLERHNDDWAGAFLKVILGLERDENGSCMPVIHRKWSMLPCRDKNIDKLIHCANKDERLNVFHSLLADAHTDAGWPTGWCLLVIEQMSGRNRNRMQKQMQRQQLEAEQCLAGTRIWTS